jgi:hypothetical protein
MDVDNTIATIAFGIGFIQMYQDLKKSETVDETSKNAILLSIVGSILWLIYQSRKYGLNFTVAYTSLGIIIQLYLLNKILVKEMKQFKD